MKKIISILTVSLMVIVFTNCSTQKDDTSKSVAIVNNNIDTTKNIETSGPQPQIMVGEEKLKKFLTFIQKNGKILPGRGACTHSYTFFDENENKYMLTALKVGKNGEMLMDGSVGKISVFLFKKGIKDSEHSFHFLISKDGISFNDAKDTEVIESCFKFLSSKI